MRAYIFLLQIMELKFSKPAFLCNFPIKRLKMERMHLFEWEDIYIFVSEQYFLILYRSITVFFFFDRGSIHVFEIANVTATGFTDRATMHACL